jgi:hypothetical protein
MKRRSKSTRAVVLLAAVFTGGSPTIIVHGEPATDESSIDKAFDETEVILDEASLANAPFQFEGFKRVHPSDEFIVYELRILIEPNDDYEYHLDLFETDRNTKLRHGASTWVESIEKTGRRVIAAQFQIGKNNLNIKEIIIWRDNPMTCEDTFTYELDLDSNLIQSRKWN